MVTSQKKKKSIVKVIILLILLLGPPLSYWLLVRYASDPLPSGSEAQIRYHKKLIIESGGKIESQESEKVKKYFE